jgi:exodeoxyribonuclease-3
MKIATWNVNGIRARKDEVAAFVEREQPDVLCLQEIKAALDHIPKTVRELPGYFCYWHGTKGYSGVALHIRKEWAPAPPGFFHPDFDHDTRIVVAELGGLALASVYVPNGGKDFASKMRFLHAMEAYAASVRARGKDLVVCGDLNVARSERDVHPGERDARLVCQRPEERALFERILAAGGLRDVGRDLDPGNDALFTWWAPWRNQRQRNVGWRLDYVLATERLAARAVSWRSQRETGTSDHAPVIATFGDATS